MFAASLLDPVRYATPAAPVQHQTGSGTGTATVALAPVAVGGALGAAFASRTGAADRANHTAPAGWTRVASQGRGNASPQLTVWQLPLPAWDPLAACVTGQVVGNGGLWWRAVAGSTGVIPGTDVTKWATYDPTAITFTDPGIGVASCTLSVIEVAGVNPAGLLDGIPGVEDGGAAAVNTMPTPLTSAEASTDHDFGWAVIAVSNTVTWLATWTGGFTQVTSQPMQSTAYAVGTGPAVFATNETWTGTGRTAVGAVVTWKARPV